MNRLDWEWVKAVNWERVALTLAVIAGYVVIVLGLTLQWFE